MNVKRLDECDNEMKIEIRELRENNIHSYGPVPGYNPRRVSQPQIISQNPKQLDETIAVATISVSDDFEARIFPRSIGKRGIIKNAAVAITGELLTLFCSEEV